MIILAIDTSCDETSVAVTDGVRVLSNVMSSQVRYHKKYGGVVPFLAQRLHAERIDAVLDLALRRAGITLAGVGAVAVTHGPGLAPALQVGVAKAKELSLSLGVPLYAVNHMVGHFAATFAAMGSRTPHPEYPLLALLTSGNHTELVIARSFGDFELLGETLDDAIGEAYDKVGRMLGLGYPAGKVMARLAKEGDPYAYDLPVPMLKRQDLNFSFSGLKNAVRLLVADILATSGGDALSRQQTADVAACFERVAQESILLKLKKALLAHPELKGVAMGGGVAANLELRRKVRALARGLGMEVWTPLSVKLCGDNAAMIGVAAYLGIVTGTFQPADPGALERIPNLRLGNR